MDALKRELGLPVGFSDHIGTETLAAAAPGRRARST
jgi:hypothetical protein